MLTVKRIRENDETYYLTEKLIKSSFPPDEQESMERLMEMTKLPIVNFSAYYDDGVYCGMSYTVHTEDLIFMLYLAVPAELRSKRYGSLILEYLNDYYDGRPMVLHVEEPSENSLNREQRIRRIKFYERNGFNDTGYRLNNDTDVFYLLSNAEDFQIRWYMELMDVYSGGTYTPQVYYKE